MIDYLKAANRLRRLLARMKEEQDPELKQIVEILERFGKRKTSPLSTLFREAGDLFRDMQVSPGMAEIFKSMGHSPSQEEDRLRGRITALEQEHAERSKKKDARIEAMKQEHQQVLTALKGAREEVNRLLGKNINLESDKAARDYQIEALKKEIEALRETVSAATSEDLSGRFVSIVDAKQAEIDRLKAAVPAYEVLDTLRRYCLGVIDPSSIPVDERLKLFQQLLAMVS